jgi:hypothetical protein
MDGDANDNKWQAIALNDTICEPKQGTIKNATYTSNPSDLWYRINPISDKAEINLDPQFDAVLVIYDKSFTELE